MPDDAVYTSHGATLSKAPLSVCLSLRSQNVLGPAPSVLSENVLGMQAQGPSQTSSLNQKLARYS